MPTESRSLSPPRNKRKQQPPKRSLSADRSTSNLNNGLFGNTRGLLRTVSTDGYDQSGFLSLFGLVGASNERKSADRDKTYFNILGTDGLVSTDHVLQEIELTRTTQSVTQLELEDIVCRKQGFKRIFWSIQKLLSSNDDDDQSQRQWQSIKFTDTISVFSVAMSQFVDYETKQQQLWDLINDDTGSYLAFEVKIMMDEGTSIETFIKLMRLLHNSDKLQKIEFGGAAFVGCRQKDVPNILASLFQHEEDEAGAGAEEDDNSFYTVESVTINLSYYAAEEEDEEENHSSEMIEKCIKKMSKLIRRERSSSPNKKTTTKRSRSKSPKSDKKRSRSPSPKPDKRSRSPSPKPDKSRSPSPTTKQQVVEPTTTSTSSFSLLMTTTTKDETTTSASSPTTEGGDDPDKYWRSTVDPTTGDTYYYNKMTKETSWDKPSSLKLMRSLSTPPPPRAGRGSGRSSSNERKSRKDRINNKKGGKRKNSKDKQSLVATSHHDIGGKETTTTHSDDDNDQRPKLHRQNTTPITKKDRKFLAAERRNSPPFRWEKYQVMIKNQNKNKVVDLQKDVDDYLWDEPSHNPPSA